MELVGKIDHDLATLQYLKPCSGNTLNAEVGAQDAAGNRTICIGIAAKGDYLDDPVGETFGIDRRPQGRLE